MGGWILNVVLLCNPEAGITFFKTRVKELLEKNIINSKRDLGELGGGMRMKGRILQSSCTWGKAACVFLES